MAHRQTWFRSGTPGITGRDRTSSETNITQSDRQSTARWMDYNSEVRIEMAIYDLVNSENVRAREIASAFEKKDLKLVERLSQEESVLAILNRLLKLSNLDINIFIGENDEISATRKGSKPYSIAKLSDGERNAILIAANILTAPKETLLLIDEPERHLHRSIISPLLTLLLKERPDCYFVVSTHEPMLPVDNVGSKILLIRSCVYSGDRVTSYDLDTFEDSTVIDDELKRTILGERRKILFVEGSENSLDKPLYSLLFPNASIVPKSSCRDVENAVIGIRGTHELHWLKPFGLVDEDHSELKRITELRDKGVYTINAYSVESIYYHPTVQALAGEKLISVFGGNIEEKLNKSKNDAIKAIKESSQHLCLKIAEKSARVKIFSLLPTRGEMEAGTKKSINIDYHEFIQKEQETIHTLIESSNFEALLKRYPIRESGALNAIARALDFKNSSQYEAAVRKVLVDDESAVDLVRDLLGTFPVELKE